MGRLVGLGHVVVGAFSCDVSEFVTIVAADLRTIFEEVTDTSTVVAFIPVPVGAITSQVADLTTVVAGTSVTRRPIGIQTIALHVTQFTAVIAFWFFVRNTVHGNDLELDETVAADLMFSAADAATAAT